MKYQLKKLYSKETKCKHCLEMLRMAEKWCLPEDTQKWSCDNCNSQWNIICNEINSNIKLTIWHNRGETIISHREFWLCFNANDFKEVDIN